MHVVIEVTSGPHRGQRFQFDRRDCFLFGRSKEARLSLPADGFVSRHHFLLELGPAGCRLTDLESKNGTVVGRTRFGGRTPLPAGVIAAPAGMRTRLLADGDEVVVGQTTLRLRIDAPSDARSPACGKEVETRSLVASPLRQGEAETLSFAPSPVPDEDQSQPTRPPSGEAVSPAGSGGMRWPHIPGFEFVRELGRGGMGVVLEARHRSGERPVAVKLLHPEQTGQSRAVEQFLHEMHLTAQLEHPNVVRCLDRGVRDDVLYLVMEFVDGVDLFRLVREAGGRLPLATAAPLMLEILDGLAHAHRASIEATVKGESRAFGGLVHRDLKPGNVLLERTGGAIRAKVADFGLAKAFDSAGLTSRTSAGQVAGTPFYWPREQITHYRWLDPASDVFSAAAVFHEALTGGPVRDGFSGMTGRCRAEGRRPTLADFIQVIAAHPAVPIRQRCPEIPVKVAEVIDRALAESELPQDPHAMRNLLGTLRYPDAGAFRDALAHAL